MVTKIQEQDSIVEQNLALTDVITQFGQSWFDKLNRHVDVENIIEMVSETYLEMVFSEQTIKDRQEFRQWYKTVGETYYDQNHTIEKFDVQISDAAEIDVVVVWRAKQRADDESLAVRVTQSWIVTQSLTTGLPVITKYVVNSFSDI